MNVAFMPSIASFSTTFLGNCGRGESLITCLKAVVGVILLGHAPCRIFLLQQSLFLCQLNFTEIMRLSQS